MAHPTLRRACAMASMLVAVLGSSRDASAQQQGGRTRWTAATPDEMVDLALERAKRGGDDALAGLLVAAALDERAELGRARRGLLAIGREGGPMAEEARWLALALEPEPVSRWPGLGAVPLDAPPDPEGIVRTLAILGPFQDTGGGLERREGPEAPGQSFGDTTARYSWGVYEVKWRRAFPRSAGVRGLPLDLYIHPRTESCTYVASRVTVPTRRTLVLRAAASGSFRLMWDGADVAVAYEVHPRMVLDRKAVKIDAQAGEHLVAAKVCSGALPDDGRVRLRFTDESGRPMPLATSSDLSGLPAALRTARPAAAPSKAPAAAQKSLALSPGVSALRTPLEAALDLEPAAAAPQATKGKRAALRAPEPTIERLMNAAIARTLGGAEDLRSPRAPGLLDRIARTPGIGADVLAMAGWISPFGANRSGWLNLARERAKKESDRATESFSLRRLAASHLTYPDWASATVAEEPLASEKDPEARLLRALIAKHMGQAGLGRAALETLLSIADAKKDATPLSVWTEIADLARNDPALLRKAAANLAASRAEARGPAWVRSFRSEGGAAVEIAAADALGEQTHADAVIQIGLDLLAAGRDAWALEALSLAVELAPNRAAAHRGLASALQARIAASRRVGADTSADEQRVALEIARARDLEPGDPALKAELSFRLGGPGPAGMPEAREAMNDERYIVAPDVFLARARKNPAKKGEVFDRQLHWIRVVTYHADKRVSQLMHYAREIVVLPRGEADLIERDIPTEGDETELLFARVHKKNGAVLAPEQQSAGGARPFVRWPELERGDVVEVAVRSWTAEPVGRRGDPPFYFIDYVGSTDTRPVLYNEVVIDSPQGSPLAWDVLGGKIGRFEQMTRDGRSIVRLVWDDPVRVPDEPLAPRLSESVPVVVGSTFGSWHEFREWYRGAVAGMTEPDDQIRRLAAELTKGKRTEREKIRALFNFVADDIRYVNYVSGEWWLPNRPQELLARRQGDCDDKAILLISLLKSIGIQATEVLVQTRYTAEPGLLRSEKVAIPMFDHGIAYLPGKNGAPGTWLDATSPQSRLGPLPAMDARAVALFVEEGPARIVDTPSSSPADHGVDATWTIRLEPDGAGTLIAKERHVGDAAFELRKNLAEPDARAQYLEQVLAGTLTGVEVTGAIDFVADLPNGAADLSYQARSLGMARREGDELAVPIGEVQTLTSQLAPLVKRTLPVVLPPRLAPSHQTRVTTIVAPPGFEVGELPPGGAEDAGELGSARVEFSRPAGKKDTVVVRRTVTFDLSTIPVDKYAKWRAWLQRVDALLHRVVRFVPSKQPGTRRAAEARP